MAHSNRNQNNQQPNFDLNALAQMDLPSLLNLLSKIDPNQFVALMSQVKIDPNDEQNVLKEGDPRIDFARSLKPLMPPENAHLIDELISIFSGKQKK